MVSRASSFQVAVLAFNQDEAFVASGFEPGVFC